MLTTQTDDGARARGDFADPANARRGTGPAGNSVDDGPATSALLNAPHALAVTADGSFLIADFYNNVVRKVSDRSAG